MPKKGKIKSVFQAHTKLTALFLVAYLIFSLIFDPRFLISDFRDKYKALAEDITVTLLVAAPPEKPEVTVNAGCSSESPYVDLSWTATANTDSYDIYRDSLILATDLTGTSYKDETIQENVSYGYQVVSKGSGGSTSSDSVTSEVPECAVPLIPFCQVLTIEATNLLGYFRTPEIHNRIPTFTGTTNINSAHIEIIITSRTIFGFTSANANGYWSWKTTEKLDYGKHIVLITATDPLDPNNTTSTSLSFELTKDKDTESKNEVKKDKEKLTSPFTILQQSQKSPEPEKSSIYASVTPLEIFLKVSNSNNVVYGGEMLDFSIKVNKNNLSLEEKIHYQITDREGNTIWESIETETLKKGDIIKKQVPISRLVFGGQYKISARIENEGDIITAEDNFQVKEIPLFNLGNISLTFTQSMSYLSWIVLLSISLLIILLVLVRIEHHLYKQSSFHITENYLFRKGFIKRRKEVSH